MTYITRWTTDVVETLPIIEGERYELIDGELVVTRQPHASHQRICNLLIIQLYLWDPDERFGYSYQAPGLIFAAADAVAPDLIWASHERLEIILDEDGKFYAAPELVIEIVSPGSVNAGRDRELKLALYERYAVPEYWIVDGQSHSIEVYELQIDRLVLTQTLRNNDMLVSKVLPGFACPMSRIFR